MEVNRHEESGLEYLKIVVEPYPYPISYWGQYHYRSGSTKQKLQGPALLQASYRTMAEQAQVALGSVSILLRGLQQLDLLRDESGKRRWLGPAQVLRRWVDAYGEVVRPKLAAQAGNTNITNYQLALQSAIHGLRIAKLCESLKACAPRILSCCSS